MQAIEEYLRRVRGVEGLVGVILFGSVARGQAFPFPKSDVDLVVVCRGLPPDLWERAELVRRIEDSPSIFQSVWMTPEESEEQLASKAGYLLDAVIEGVILFDPERYLERKREELKRELERKGVRKVNGAWVWPVKRLGDVIELQTNELAPKIKGSMRARK